MTDEPDVLQAAHAFRSAVEALAHVVPDGAVEHGSDGVLLAFTGSLIPALNVVMSVNTEPDAAEISRLGAAAAARARGFPWSIRLRGDADEKIVRIAADHGLTTRTRQPFMLLRLSDDRRPFPEPAGVRVRRLRGAEYETFATVLGTAFGAPPALISSLYTPEILDQPGITAYVAEARGVPTAAGLAVVTEQHVGLANIGTLPDYRRLGLGRAVTEAMLRDGLAAGAHTAYLHSTNEAVALFEETGFRTEEYWTSLSAF